MDEHRSIVKQVLQILADNKLSLYPKKCKFHQTKIKYLGVILLQDSVETDPTKMKGVAQWPEPQDKKYDNSWDFVISIAGSYLGLHK